MSVRTRSGFGRTFEGAADMTNRAGVQSRGSPAFVAETCASSQREAPPRASSKQVLDGIPLLLQLFQGRLHAATAEVAYVDALDDFVAPLFARHRIAVDDALRNAVAAVSRDAHADP